MSESETSSNKDNFKRALCYIPFGAIIFSIAEKDNKALELDIRYGIMLFLAWIILSIVMGIFGLGWLIWFLYFGLSAYLGYKAYSGEEIKISALDQAYDAILAKTK